MIRIFFVLARRAPSEKALKLKLVSDYWKQGIEISVGEKGLFIKDVLSRSRWEGKRGLEVKAEKHKKSIEMLQLIFFMQKFLQSL